MTSLGLQAVPVNASEERQRFNYPTRKNSGVGAAPWSNTSVAFLLSVGLVIGVGREALFKR